MALVRRGRLIARPNFTDLPRKKRGGLSKPPEKKMVKSGLKPRPVPSSRYGGGIVESHMDDLVDKD